MNSEQITRRDDLRECLLARLRNGLKTISDYDLVTIMDNVVAFTNAIPDSETQDMSLEFGQLVDEDRADPYFDMYSYTDLVDK